MNTYELASLLSKHSTINSSWVGRNSKLISLKSEDYHHNDGHRHSRNYAVKKGGKILFIANTKPLFFYHMVPKKANISKGLLAPYAMNKFGMEKELSFSLDKYRNRLVDTDAWNIYPNRDPKSLSNEEILNGINQFRKSEDGSKYIYFFRYPPYKELGKNMETILKSKDIYRINLNDKELQKQILDISWGWIGSNTDNHAVNKKWYETIEPEKYFSAYNDNPKNGTPLFAPLVHIGIAFKDGICQRKFLTKPSDSADDLKSDKIELVID